MERPYMNMSRPNESDYKKRTREIILYSYYEKFSYDDYEEEEENEDEEFEDQRNGWNRNANEKAVPDGETRWYSGYRDQPELPKLNLSKVTLQTLLDLLPEGVSPKDVKVRSNIDAGDMGIYGHDVEFYYKKKLPAEPEQFKKDMALYNKLYAEYEVRLAAYEQWVKDQQVKELEEKLNKLKK
jgi:hypothetical protein